jgi:hypothetical protein
MKENINKGFPMKKLRENLFGNATTFEIVLIFIQAVTIATIVWFIIRGISLTDWTERPISQMSTGEFLFILLIIAWMFGKK